MATNLISYIDPAIRRRATAYSFERPTSEGRRSVLQRSLGEVVSAADLDELNRLLDKSPLAVSAADVLHQVVSRAVREAAQHDRPLDFERLRNLAASAVPTAPVAP